MQVALAAALGLALSLASGAAPAPAWGQTPQAAVKPLPHALEKLVLSLKPIEPLPARTLYVVLPLRSDRTPLRPSALETRVLSMLAGQQASSQAPGQNAVKQVLAKSKDEALSLARGWEALVLLELEVSLGTVKATSTRFALVSNMWERAKNAKTTEVSHLFAQVPVDAEVQSFFPPIKLEEAKVTKASYNEAPILGLACDDTNADGGNELYVLTEESLSRGRLVSGKYQADAKRAWSEVGKRLPVPFRDPLGRVLLVEGAVFAGNTTYGSYRFDADLSGAKRLFGLPIWIAQSAAGEPTAVCTESLPDASAIDLGARRGCETEAPPRPAARKPNDKTRLTDAAVGQLTAQGEWHGFYRDLEGGARLQRDVGDPATDPATKGRGVKSSADKGLPQKGLTGTDVGAQLALGDLDLDGTLEVVWTQNTDERLPRGKDREEAVVVSSLFGSDLRERVRFRAPEGVRALAVCPAEALGRPALVIAFSKELWIVR
jgi:hypothetical protein